jgi:hypothetical protein
MHLAVIRGGDVVAVQPGAAVAAKSKDFDWR